MLEVSIVSMVIIANNLLETFFLYGCGLELSINQSNEIQATLLSFVRNYAG